MKRSTTICFPKGVVIFLTCRGTGGLFHGVEIRSLIILFQMDDPPPSPKKCPNFYFYFFSKIEVFIDCATTRGGDNNTIKQLVSVSLASGEYYNYEMKMIFTMGMRLLH